MSHYLISLNTRMPQCVTVILKEEPAMYQLVIISDNGHIDDKTKVFLRRFLQWAKCRWYGPSKYNRPCKALMVTLMSPVKMGLNYLLQSKGRKSVKEKITFHSTSLACAAHTN